MTQDYSTGAAPPPFRPENESASVLRGRVAQLVTDLAVQLHTAESAQATQARQRERIETLTGITKQLLSATALEEVLEAVVESASRLCDASGALVMLIDPDGPSLRP